MDMIIDGVNGKGFGTMKFQYSRRLPVYPDPRFIPHDDKKLAETILGSFFTQFLQRQYGSAITGFKHNNDDSNKKADVTFIENGQSNGVQITQLQFTRHEERKSIAKRTSKELVDSILKLITPRFPIIVNIFPVESKSVIPLSIIKNGKSKILKELSSHIAFLLRENQDRFFTSNQPIWLTVEPGSLKKHFRTIVLNKVPPQCYPRFYGRQNVFVNYDIDDVAYEEIDADDGIKAIYDKKNKGAAEILLIWSDEFELATLDKRKFAEKLFVAFQSSTFHEVFFMTFTNNPPMFVKSLQMWVIKGPRMQTKTTEAIQS